jgi:hypothetical protein
MPISLPVLDDRSFSDLVAEMQSLIPRYAQKWTNYNPADPGITMLELLSWLTETVIYRLDLVPDRNYLTFLELLGIEPSGPCVNLTFSITKDEISLPDTFTIDRGTRVAGFDESTGEEFIFETVAPVSKSGGRWDEEKKCWIFKVPAVNTIEIKDEVMGVSDESPKQKFYFKKKPLFLDKDDQAYTGNPRIDVYPQSDPLPWVYQDDLLTSNVIPPGNDKTGNGLPNTGQKHFTVDRLGGCIRFGDGIYGKIPEKNSAIKCTYRALGGEKANIGKGRITLIKDTDRFTGQGIDPLLVSVTNEYPVTGGVDKESIEDLMEIGFKEIREKYRAVSDNDFENLAKSAAPEKVARAKAVPGINLETGTAPAAAHVSVIVLPETGYLSLPPAPTAIDPASGELIIQYEYDDLTSAMESHAAEILKLDIMQYLENRRLITTKVHVVTPEFVDVDLKIEARAKPGVLLKNLEVEIIERLITFLNPYIGGQDGKGWPFGGSLYRSELYQQIEAIEGVDYVTKLWMNGQEGNNSIKVEMNQLIFTGKPRCVIT